MKLLTGILLLVAAAAWATALSSFDVAHDVPDVTTMLAAIKNKTGVQLQGTCTKPVVGPNSGKWVDSASQTVLANPCVINGWLMYGAGTTHVEIYQNLDPNDARISSMTVTQALHDSIVNTINAQ